VSTLGVGDPRLRPDVKSLSFAPCDPTGQSRRGNEMRKVASMIDDRSEDSLDGEPVRRVGEDRAEQMVAAGLAHLSVEESDLKTMGCTAPIWPRALWRGWL
jgi:hypothetical protein